MNIEFHAREYASAAEMLAAAQERRKRIFGRSTKKPAEEAARVREILTNMNPSPEWKKREIYFDAHVIDYAPFRPAPFKRWRRLIAQMVDATNLTYADVMGKTRKNKAVIVRQEIWLEMNRRGASLPFIGAIFERDHTTVLHGVQCALARRGDAGAIEWVNRKIEKARVYHEGVKAARKAENGKQA